MRRRGKRQDENEDDAGSAQESPEVEENGSAPLPGAYCRHYVLGEFKQPCASRVCNVGHIEVVQPAAVGTGTAAVL